MSLLLSGPGGGRRNRTSPLPPPTYPSDAAMAKLGFALPSAGGTIKQVKIAIQTGVTPDGNNFATQSILYVRVPHNGALDIVYRSVRYQGDGSYFGGENGCFNPPAQYYIPITNDIDDPTNFINARYANYGSDDLDPIVFESDVSGTGYYTGGNHQLPGVVTSTYPTPHGFVRTDYGQTRTCSNGHTWHLAEITTPYSLLWLSGNVSTIVGRYRFKHAADMGSTLTYVSDGTTTTALTGYTPTDGGIGQWTEGFVRTKLYVNNVEVSLWENATFNTVTGVQITQAITYFEPYSVIDYFKANSAGFTTWPLVSGTPWHTRYGIYDIQSGLFVCYEDVDTHMPIPAYHIGLQQQTYAGPLQSAFTEIIRIIPGFSPVSDGSYTYDYGAGVDILAHIYNGQLFGTPDKWKVPTEPPSRMLEVYNGTIVDGAYSQAVDFVGNFILLPIYNGDDAHQLLNDRTFWQQDRGKYSGLCYSINWTTPPMVDAETSIRATYIRGNAPTPTTSGIINDCRGTLSNGDIWCFMDISGADTYTGALATPGGKTATLFRKSSNLTISGDDLIVSDGDPAWIGVKFA